VRALRPMLAGAVVATAVAASACGGSRASAEWIASEVYVLDDRAACMAVTDRLHDRQLSVCRDDRGTISCRHGVDPRRTASGADCNAAIRAFEDWEAASATSS
jgi:hypothetical protein